MPPLIKCPMCQNRKTEVLVFMEMFEKWFQEQYRRSDEIINELVSHSWVWKRLKCFSFENDVSSCMFAWEELLLEEYVACWMFSFNSMKSHLIHETQRSQGDVYIGSKLEEQRCCPSFLLCKPLWEDWVEKRYRTTLTHNSNLTSPGFQEGERAVKHVRGYSEGSWDNAQIHNQSRKVCAGLGGLVHGVGIG